MSETAGISLDDALGVVEDLARPVGAGVSEAQLVDRLGRLEKLKCVAEAAQARAAAALDAAARVRQQEAGVPARRRGEGVAAQLALARRVSPHRGARLLGLAKILEAEMPHTLGLMAAGRLSEWRATIVARETACLELDDRRRVDLELCGAGRAAGMGERELAAAVKKLAYRLDAASVVRRAAKAETERTVTIRPAPDLMSYVTALLPVKQGVALYAALTRAADAARAAGEERSRGQVMADTLVERATGQTPAVPARIELKLVMTDRALLAGDETPALVPGYGPVPAGWARAAVTETEVFLKRLFTHPISGQLVAMDATSRRVPAGLAEFIILRDAGVCRTPYCGAPIRHLDHIEPWAAGGPTSAVNLQGLCERCNQAKEAPDWRARPGPGGTVVTTTPTGHTHASRPPEPWPSPRPLVRLRLDVDYIPAA